MKLFFIKKVLKKKVLIIITFISIGLGFLSAQAISELPIQDILGKEYYVYEVKKNESLYGIAKRFGWDTEELIRLNPETAHELKKGSKLYYPTGNDSYSLNESEVDYHQDNIRHTVKKGESIYSISRQYDVPLDIIYQYNPQATKGVKQGEIIEIPREVKSVPEKPAVAVLPSPGIPEVLPPDELEESNYYFETTDSINQENINQDIVLEERQVKIALILDEPSGKKDIDFTRGVLVALSQMENTPYKIDLKVFDGGVSSNDLLNELEEYEPSLLISTADKVFPAFLADYGNTNNVAIVNVFDLKTDLYLDNGSIIQILPPSSVFNEKISSRIYQDYNGRKLLVVGEIDDNDGIGVELRKNFDNKKSISLEEFGALEPDIMESILIYPNASKKEEVSDFLNNVDNLLSNYPGLDYKIIGRLSWVAMTDDFGDKFEDYEVEIPSRVWLDMDSNEWKDFVTGYQSLFDGTPIRSIPNFAASGYDIARYFIPFIAKEQGYLNHQTQGEMFLLQNDINLHRLNDKGGLVNVTGYLIKFGPEGFRKKIIVK